MVLFKELEPKPGGASSSPLANGTIVLANRGTTDSGTDHLEFFAQLTEQFAPNSQRFFHQSGRSFSTRWHQLHGHHYRINDADSPTVEAAILDL